jgi:ribonucleoside-diphosphate reductase alpha chain
MYLLLCGCGTGFSVQKTHVKHLPEIAPRIKGKKTFVIPDNIEGWADAIGIVVNSFFKTSTSFSEYNGYEVEFDFSEIRTEGSFISGGFKAPGPEGLKNSINKIVELIESRIEGGYASKSEFCDKLRPIDAYDVIMHMSDAVLSGGVRRSATICVFSPDDDEMLNAKTGDWFIKNPQRGRSNNSVLLVRDKTTKEDFTKIMESVKDFGEPGFVWAEDEGVLYNPCVEIGFYPQLDTKKLSKEQLKTLKSSDEYKDDKRYYSGWQACNLCEINGKKLKTEEDMLQACRAAAIIGTMQADYTTFPYLGKVSQLLVEHEALLGVSMTGMMDSPEIIFDPKIQRKGAKEVLKTNERIAEIIGVNPCARGTCVKPAGTTSCVLGSSSGIHPHHARRYMRRVQANKLEFPLQEFMKHNPHAVEESVWSNNGTDMVITFLCEVPIGSVTKNQMGAVDLLEKVKLTQQNWVEAGTRIDRCTKEFVRHNVSNTITVQPDEWDELTNYIYKNRKWFAGISLLPASGDKDYPQAPFTTVHTPVEIVKTYGDASVFASGLIVDGLHAFNNNLWSACDCANGIGEQLDETCEEPQYPKGRNYKELAAYFTAKEEYDEWWRKTDWIRRAIQFSERYFDGDLRQMTYCLKDVSNWKLWCDLHRDYKDIDWSVVVEEDAFYQNVDETAGAACAGGRCELG